MDLNGNEIRQLDKSDTLKLRLKHVGSPTSLYFQEDPIKIVRGEGQYLIDESGNRYLDCINNVAHVGHSHPAIAKACSMQISELCTNSRFLHDSNSICAQRLTDSFPDPLNVCFFTNSGSEANDLALTLAAAYTGGKDVITLGRAYHGHVRSCFEISPYKWIAPSKEKKDYVHVASSPDVYRGKFADSDNPTDEMNREIRDIIQKIHQKAGKVKSDYVLQNFKLAN